MYRYIKSNEETESVPSWLKSLKWEKFFEDEYSAAVAQDEDTYYGAGCIWLDATSSEEHYNEQYLAFIGACSEVELDDYIEDHAIDNGGIDKLYWSFECIYENLTDSSVVAEIGWFEDADTAKKACLEALGL